MLIDVSYFTSGPRHILNASTNATPAQNSVSVNKFIMGYVSHYQLAFLCEMLGDDLAASINAYLVEKDEAEPAEEQSEFVVNEGYELLCDKLRESFADYVFFYILRDANTQSTDRGIVIWKNENETVAPIHRQCAVWNEMVNRNIRFKAWAAGQTAAPYCLAAVSDNMVTRINPFNL
ncbi:MAG: hypothetical protein IJS04_02375 [Muribaculaceae bacterium]|nr:hypothetical protein [Muribaculaceae bacterium]